MDEYTEIVLEAESVGLVFDAVRNGNAVFVGNNDLSEYIHASHGKPLDSEECLALQTYLGGAEDPRWLAYVECRKQPIRQQREARYKSETDPLFMKACEDYVVGTEDWNTAITAWKTAKNIIREELPYPE
jgi:hypothetical protein